jgi:outer membrane protein assembly factor BamE (lipoprotein component of BamABCDE complex)
MTGTRRKILIAIAFVLLVFGAELTREKIDYVRQSKNLQHAYWKIKPGMTKEQVISIIGPPDVSSKQDAEEYCHWLARERKGFLLKQIQRSSGNYELVVSFDDNGQVIDAYSGTN